MGWPIDGFCCRCLKRWPNHFGANYGVQAINPRKLEVPQDVLYTDIWKPLCSFLSLNLYLTITVQSLQPFVKVHTGSSIECCRQDGKPLTPRYIHPYCLQVVIPDNDPDYSPYGAKCMNYVRSVTSLRSKCNFGPADQVRRNQEINLNLTPI